MKEKTQPCDSSRAQLLSAANRGKQQTIKGTWAPLALTSVSLGINLCLPWNYRYDQFDIQLQLRGMLIPSAS